MSNTRLAVLVWTDDAGVCTGVVAERPEIAAVGSTPQDVLAQLKEHLQFLLREQEWEFPQEPMIEPQLVRFSVDVRPEYQERGRRFPAGQPVRISVPCVVGDYESGVRACIVPTFQLWFSLEDGASLQDLVQHYITEAMRGSTPQHVARSLPPPDCALHTLVISDRARRGPAPARRWEALESVAEPLGDRVLRRRLSRSFEREHEAAHLRHRVTHDRANVLLVGDRGCGKSSLLASTAREIERGAARDPEKETRRLFWLTSAARLIAGMQYLGQWEERLEQVVSELAEFDGILCLENLLDLLKVGGTGAADSVGAFLVPYLRARELRLIAEATPAELDASRRLLPGLVDAMQVLPLRTFDSATSERALARLAEAHARSLRAEFDPGVPGELVRLFSRFAPYEPMPGRAASVLLHMLHEGAAQSRRVTRADAISTFAVQSGVPEPLLRDELPLTEETVRGRLASRVLGQPAACRLAACVVTTFKAGLNDPLRPLGVLLFVGPTGVGKTELAGALADELFGHSRIHPRMIRLDMSEYSMPGSAERLLQDDSGTPSELIRRMREQPFCLLLLDEIEKASPDVFDVLLGVFDEGRLTDRYGGTTYFRSSLVIMTSNLGAQSEDSIGFGNPRDPDYSAAASKYFRPEFYNRIDSVVPFAALDPDTILQIAEKELRSLCSREGLLRKGIQLRWSRAVVERVAAAGFDRRFGARPLQRAVERLVVTPLARAMAENPSLAGPEIRLDLDARGNLVAEA